MHGRKANASIATLRESLDERVMAGFGAFGSAFGSIGRASGRLGADGPASGLRWALAGAVN